MAEETNFVASRFLVRNPEKADFNQYWYSQKTIETLLSVVSQNSQNCAFISTPSLFFSLPPSSPLRTGSKVFDFDKKWAADAGFVFYDFNAPTEIGGKENEGKFDMVVIDPPFITREVWEKYAITAKLLLKENGKILISTIAENAGMMKELLDVTSVAFKPSIPHLVYQYSLYTNFASEILDRRNEEVPDDD